MPKTALPATGTGRASWSLSGCRPTTANTAAAVRAINQSALKQDNSSGYAAVRHGAGLMDRPASGRILLTGADRRSYLQGLLTNDIEALTPGTGCYAAMLTAQGRMMTDMRVLGSAMRCC